MDGKEVKLNPNQVLGMKKVVQKAKPGERCYMPQDSKAVDLDDPEDLSLYESGTSAASIG